MNAFDSANYPTTEPDELIAGDRIAWKRTDLGADYPPASYTLKYSARLENGGSTEIEITAAGSGSNFVVEVPSATSNAWTPGRYHWQAYIVRNSDSARVTIDSGSFEVLPNRDTATSDPRSHAKKVLDAIEAVIEGRASTADLQVTIAGRMIQKYTPEQLIMLRNKYKAEYESELQAERIAKGLGSGSKILVRFN